MSSATGKRNAVVFLVVTAALLVAAGRLRIGASLERFFPADHPYKEAFFAYEDVVPADTVSLLLAARSGRIFTPAFFRTLEQVTAAARSVPGADRANVQSLFTPHGRVFDATAEGVAATAVIPPGFAATASELAGVEKTLRESSLVGRLVSPDFSSALIKIPLIDAPAESGRASLSASLAEIERRFESDQVDIHATGVPVLRSSLQRAFQRALISGCAAFLASAVFVFFIVAPRGLAVRIILSAIIAAIWQAGVMAMARPEIAPHAVFLFPVTGVLALAFGMTAVRAHPPVPCPVHRGASVTFAAASLLAGFGGLLAVTIPAVRDAAWAGLLGVAAATLAHVVLVRRPSRAGGFPSATFRFPARVDRVPDRYLGGWWRLAIFAALLLAGAYAVDGLSLDAAQRPFPDLVAAAPINRDATVTNNRMSQSSDVFIIFAAAEPDACTDPEVMRAVDEFGWRLAQASGITAVTSLAKLAKRSTALWYENFIKWRVIPADPAMLAQAVAAFPPSTGLLNFDCSVMPIYAFLADHGPDTVAGAVDAANRLAADLSTPELRFRLAGGNVALFAATRDAVRAALPTVAIVLAAGAVLFPFFYWRPRRALATVVSIAAVYAFVFGGMRLFAISVTPWALVAVAMTQGVAALVFEQRSRMEAILVVLPFIALPVVWMAAPLSATVEIGVPLLFALIGSLIVSFLQPLPNRT